MKIKNEILKGFKVMSLDGISGKVYDFYFDYATWSLTHLTVGTDFFASQRTLVPIDSIKKIDFANNLIHVELLKFHIDKGPKVNRNTVIAGSYYSDYWQWYYAVPVRPKPIDFCGPLNPMLQKVKTKLEKGARYYPLKSINGMKLNFLDQKKGNVCGAVLDCEDWFVKHLIVKTSQLPLTNKHLVNLSSVRSVDWVKGLVEIEMYYTDFTALIESNDQEQKKEVGSNLKLDLNGQPTLDKDIYIVNSKKSSS